MPPLVLLISAPSGTGKTTLMQMMLSSYPELQRLVSTTTRPIRQGERDGIDYHFVSKEEYNTMKAKGDFLETAEIYGYSYGTPKSSLDKVINKGQHAIVSLDYRGFFALRRTLKNIDIVDIFVLPPSMSQLKDRLLKRSPSCGEDEIKLRMQNAEKEMSYASQYSYTIINDDLATAFRRLSSIYQGRAVAMVNKITTV